MCLFSIKHSYAPLHAELQIILENRKKHSHNLPEKI